MSIYYSYVYYLKKVAEPNSALHLRPTTEMVCACGWWHLAATLITSGDVSSGPIVSGYVGKFNFGC